MSIGTAVRAITLAIAVALTVIAINLQPYVAPPVLWAETVTAERTGGDEEAEAASYTIELALNSQLCPC